MKNFLIQNAVIWPIEGEKLQNGYLFVENGKIVSIGDMSALPKITDGIPVFDAQGGYVLPGFVEAHSHIGLYEDSIGLAGEDGNEDTDPVTPQLRVIDGINPMERAFQEAREAGVTTVVVSPGSANPIGGQIAAMKTYGRRIDDMLLKAPLAMKMALGENPKMSYHDRDETPVTRMATVALIREQLAKAAEYCAHKMDPEMDDPEYDAKLDALLPLIKGEIPVHFHAHRADDIFTALRIANEFQLKTVIVHGTEAYLVADILAQEQVPIISGPILTDRSKPELVNQTEQAAGILARAGILTALSTDHPETPEKYLLHTALTAVRAGMEEEAALRAITIDSAKIAGLDAWVGSLKVGKDGDAILYSGHPFDYKTQVQAVFCDGICVYRRK